MAVNFNGGFKIGGVEYRHPLSSEEIRFLLTILKHILTKLNYTNLLKKVDIQLDF